MSTSSTSIQPPLFDTVAAHPGDLEAALSSFAQFPYKKRPYCARNWGHPLHSLCSYASKMKPAIANMLVNLFTEADATVLDPFAGSGTVPLEAAMQGRNSIAVDLSPLAFCISAAKVDAPTPESVEFLLQELEAAMRRVEPDEYEVQVEDEVVTFYHPDTLREVLQAKRFFDEREASGTTNSAHWFVKACILHLLHGNRPYALSRRSHGIIPIPPKGPATYKALMNSLRDKVNRAALNRLPSTYRSGLAIQGSALRIALEPESVDAIITSPPFLGTTEFLRHNRVRLWFCGWSYATQLEKKAQGEFLEHHKTLDAYGDILLEFRRLLKPTGLAVLHLGVVKRKDMALHIASLAPQHGFQVAATLYEDATALETHGRTDRGATSQHQFLFLRPA